MEQQVHNQRGENMKRVIVGGSILLLVTTLCYAQIARFPASTAEIKTTTTNLSVTGLDVAGNPGFIELVGANDGTTPIVYYLWVDTDGDLRIASRVAIEAYTSFPNGEWKTYDMEHGTTVVGNQS